MIFILNEYRQHPNYWEMAEIDHIRNNNNQLMTNSNPYILRRKSNPLELEELSYTNINFIFIAIIYLFLRMLTIFRMLDGYLISITDILRILYSHIEKDNIQYSLNKTSYKIIYQ